MIGLKNSYFPLSHLPSCYWTVQWINHIQSCSKNQPITNLVSITIETVYRPPLSNLPCFFFIDSKLDFCCVVVQFCYHEYDYRHTETSLSPITSTYQTPCLCYLPQPSPLSDSVHIVNGLICVHVTKTSVLIIHVIMLNLILWLLSIFSIIKISHTCS